MKHVYQFDQQDEHDQEFEPECPRLVKLIDQEAVQVFRGRNFATRLCSQGR
jgi:hypothetical protein